jgi:hypothetical protein
MYFWQFVPLQFKPDGPARSLAGLRFPDFKGRARALRARLEFPRALPDAVCGGTLSGRRPTHFEGRWTAVAGIPVRSLRRCRDRFARARSRVPGAPFRRRRGPVERYE